MERIILFVIIAIILIIPIIIYLNKKRKQKFLVYLPSIILFMLAVIFYLWGQFLSESMQDLGMYIMSMICTILAIISALVALIIKNRRK